MFGITAFAQSPFASLGGAFYGVVVNETETLSSTGDSQFDFLSTQSEITVILAAQTATEAFLLFSVESTILTDLATASQGFPVAQNGNTQTLTTVQDVLAAFIGIQNNTQTLTAIQDVLAAFLASQTEVETLSDVDIVQRDTVRSTADILTLTSAEIGLAQFVSFCTDSLITLSDYQIGKGWFNIDDRQNITWVRIDGTQVPLWGAINDTQNPNWVRIDDTQ